MAYVVARQGGRFEIRESTATARGPRSRTLATFAELTDDVLAHAEMRAGHTIHRDELRRSARRAGAPVAPPAGDVRAGDLLAALAVGSRPTPVRARLVAHALAPTEVTAPEDHLRAAGEWAGADAGRRAEALVDLLGLVDALPPRRRRARRSAFPQLSSTA
jgi:hypothetical protein